MMVSREHIEYLQRSGRKPEPIPQTASGAAIDVKVRCLSRIRIIGIEGSKPSSEEGKQTPSADLPISLNAGQVSITYLVLSRKSAVEIYIGNWQRGTSDSSQKDVDSRQQIIAAALSSLYPASDLENLSAGSLQDLMTYVISLKTAGYALGSPTMKPAP